MTLALKIRQVVGSVANHLATNLTVSTAVEYPGGFVDTGAISDWVCVRVESMMRNGQRRLGTDHGKVLIAIEIYAKRTTATYRVTRIEEDIRTVLRHAEILVKDYDDSSEPTVGYLRVLEPDVESKSKDFSSPTGVTVRSDVRVLSVEFPALLQAA